MKESWSSSAAADSVTKKGRVAELSGGVPDEIDQRWCGTRFARELCGAAADDVRQQERADFLEVAGSGEARSHLAAAVAAVGIGPILDGFFAVEEGDPDGVASVVRAKKASELQHYGGGRATVVGADKVFQLFCVVVRAEQNDFRFFAGNFHQNIFHLGPAGGGVCAEGVGLDGAAVAFQFREKIFLDLCDGGRARGTRAETDLFGDVSEGAVAIEAAGFIRRRSFV